MNSEFTETSQDDWPLALLSEDEYLYYLTQRAKAGERFGHFSHSTYRFLFQFDHGAPDDLEKHEAMRGLGDPLWSMVRAKRDCGIPDLYGARALTIIADPGVEVSTGGHNRVLHMDRFSSKEAGSVFITPELANSFYNFDMEFNPYCHLNVQAFCELRGISELPHDRERLTLQSGHGPWGKIPEQDGLG